jgi:hypothetical protein
MIRKMGAAGSQNLEGNPFAALPRRKSLAKGWDKPALDYAYHLLLPDNVQLSGSHWLCSDRS